MISISSGLSFPSLGAQADTEDERLSFDVQEKI
jgi:hypothetical protein